MRISDWSSDVCSSDLPGRGAANAASPARQRRNLDACEKNCGCRRGPGSGGGGCYRTWRTDRRAGQAAWNGARGPAGRSWLQRFKSEEHTSELQSLMRISYSVFCLKKKKRATHKQYIQHAEATR